LKRITGKEKVRSQRKNPGARKQVSPEVVYAGFSAAIYLKQILANGIWFNDGDGEGGFRAGGY
jgi:hypothetical protein